MRKLAVLIATLAMPFSGFAQTLAPVSSADSLPSLAAPNTQPQLLEQILAQSKLLGSVDTHAVPLWGTPDGHVLAMVASSGDSFGPLAPTMPPQLAAPGEWRLIDVTNIVSSGLTMRLNDKTSAHINLVHSSVLAPENVRCEPNNLSSQCLTASSPIARGGEMQFGTSWLASDSLNLDFSYGLSWLRRDNGLVTSLPIYNALATMGSAGSPMLIVPGGEYANWQNSSFNALGRWKLSDAQALDFGASLGRIQLSAPSTALPLTSLNQAAVSFGVEYGSFTGTLTGRMLGPTEPFGNVANLGNSRWTGLDVGISWRTPWSGMLRFGTQNLWSSGTLPYPNEPASRELDAAQSRVPYVQYHQDL